MSSKSVWNKQQTLIKSKHFVLVTSSLIAGVDPVPVASVMDPMLLSEWVQRWKIGAQLLLSVDTRKLWVVVLLLLSKE